MQAAQSGLRDRPLGDTAVVDDWRIRRHDNDERTRPADLAGHARIGKDRIGAGAQIIAQSFQARVHIRCELGEGGKAGRRGEWVAAVRAAGGERGAAPRWGRAAP